MRRAVSRCVAAGLAVLALFAAGCPDARAQGGITVAPRSAAEANQQAKEQTQTLGSAIRTLRLLAGQPEPRGLSAVERTEWDAQSKWLESMVSRLAAHAVRLRPIATGSSANMVHEMTRLNFDYLSLRKDLKREALRIRTLSDDARTRYNAAMRAIGHLE